MTPSHDDTSFKQPTSRYRGFTPATVPSPTSNPEFDARGPQYHHPGRLRSLGGPSSGPPLPPLPPQHVQQQQQQQQQQQERHHSRTKTPPGPLPRSSSLYPPPQLLEAARLSPAPGFDASKYQSGVVVKPAVIDVQPHSQQQPPSQSRRPDSRSSSFGDQQQQPDSTRNHNRWSVSTSSSKVSPPHNHRARRSSHRMSIDASSWLGHSNNNSVDQSPRKLQKNHRRSSSVEAASLVPTENNPPSRKPPLPDAPPHLDLPPIAAFSSLEESMQSGFGLDWGTATDIKLESDQATADAIQPTRFNSETGRRVKTPEPRAILGNNGVRTPVMTQDREADSPAAKGHGRTRSHGGRGTPIPATTKFGKSNKGPSQKAMLSRALEKANTAVQLDNAQNFEGARQSYVEACDLLSQVLSRTSTDEDKRKLDAIRQTYTSRIDEINQMQLAQPPEGKALPARPESLGLKPGPVLRVDDGESEEQATVETATLARISNGGDGPSLPLQAHQEFQSAESAASPHEINGRSDLRSSSRQDTTGHSLQSSFAGSLVTQTTTDNNTVLQKPKEDTYIPPPLSPRRPPSPRNKRNPSPDAVVRADFSMRAHSRNDSDATHARGISHGSNSWLDAINESGGSSASSVHSRTSSQGFRRKHIRGTSGDTEAEFDAALDAAVEAAYNDGYEVIDDPYFEASEPEEDVIAKAMKRVQLAKERVRQTEREAFEEQQRMKQRQDSNTIGLDFYDDGSSDEEERMLEEMTKSIAANESLSGQAPVPVPRESDSSGFTTRTWHSSQGSNPPTTATTLATVAEPPSSSTLSKFPEEAVPPPTQSLPQVPSKSGSAWSRSEPPASGQGVRSRRLSGQNPKQLKIETGKNGRFGQPSQLADIQAEEEDSGATSRQGRRPSLDSMVSPTTHQPPPPPTPPVPDTAAPDPATDSRSSSPAPFPPTLRKNYSSSSLRSMRSRNMSISNLDDASDMSPSTPLSSGFGSAGGNRVPAMPTIATPLASAFGTKVMTSGGLYLFDDTFHSPTSPGSPNLLLMDSPAPLEPCPTDYLLRPFWMMRCLYQTLCHPRGGYLNNKLFVPRDVWKVKGVKLRNVEDKISSCDYLTAALLKLAKVDTCDADAVLEEMQSLEGVLEQVQTTLSRRLGVEVGVQGSGSLFNASNSADTEAAVNVPRSTSISAKSSSFSWRRLRSKSSGMGLASTYSAKTNGPETAGSGKESPGLETLPMTTNPTSRPTKRDVGLAQFTGPNASYMGSLARLFDAAQAIDQIARQVDDPGLRHADKTQVGLELCTRHAAEFFAFYICRFVLTDVGLLLDKFIKRGSEWVMA